MDAIKATGQIPRRKRVHTFIGCCPLRLIFEDGNEGLIGRGSGGLLIRMAVTAGQKASMPVIEVGNFCEAAQCEIQIGGEHPNAKVFNNSLSGLPLLRGFLKNQGIATYQATHPKPTRIGHGVILSKSCLINTGAEIGTGSVIGSGAIVTRSAIPDWSVAAGNPARVVKQRISKEGKRHP